MRLRDEVRVGLWVSVVFQIAMMVVTVMLLSRMTPAVNALIDRNEVSIASANRMLATLVIEPLEPSAAAEFETAFAEAAANITEDGEARVIEDIRRWRAASLRGDPAARVELARQITELATLNSKGMRLAEKEFVATGIGGSWAVVGLGVLGLLVSYLASKRLGSRIAEPVEEMRAVLEACGRGETRRRFHANDTSLEFRQVGEVINRLIDEHFRPRSFSWEELAALERLAVQALMDAQPVPMVVLDAKGGVVVASDSALVVLSRPIRERLRESLHACAQQGADGKVSTDGIEVMALGDRGFLCKLNPQQIEALTLEIKEEERAAEEVALAQSAAESVAELEAHGETLRQGERQGALANQEHGEPKSPASPVDRPATQESGGAAVAGPKTTATAVLDSTPAMRAPASTDVEESEAELPGIPVR